MSHTENTDTTPGRGEDERRTTVDPARDPAPVSPPADQAEVEKGREKLDSVVTK